MVTFNEEIIIDIQNLLSIFNKNTLQSQIIVDRTDLFLRRFGNIKNKKITMNFEKHGCFVSFKNCVSDNLPIFQEAIE